MSTIFVSHQLIQIPMTIFRVISKTSSSWEGYSNNSAHLLQHLQHFVVFSVKGRLQNPFLSFRLLALKSPRLVSALRLFFCFGSFSLHHFKPRLKSENMQICGSLVFFFLSFFFFKNVSSKCREHLLWSFGAEGTVSHEPEWGGTDMENQTCTVSCAWFRFTQKSLPCTHTDLPPCSAKCNFYTIGSLLHAHLSCF